MADLIGEDKLDKTEFQFRNILPIPHVLTKAYLELESFDPQTVALAFFTAMTEFDKKKSDQLASESETIPPLQDETDHEETKSKENTDEKSFCSDHENNGVNKVTILSEFLHILQFCHLCYKKKIHPISCSVGTNKEIEKWYNSVCFFVTTPTSTRSKRQVQQDDEASISDDEISSPDQKLSKKDHIFLSAMMKINDAMDKNHKDKSEKEPGFNCLEEHRKNLILNASATTPFDEQVSQPTEFFTAFLARKSQFKVKDMLLHCLQSGKICFNPGASFINNLWKCDFFWLLPDTPSGISIFFLSGNKISECIGYRKRSFISFS